MLGGQLRESKKKKKEKENLLYFNTKEVHLYKTQVAKPVNKEEVTESRDVWMWINTVQISLSTFSLPLFLSFSLSVSVSL